MTTEPPAHLIDWHGNDWTPDSDDAGRAPQRALHDVRADQDPAIAPEWEDPAGVPIDAMLFGGRRSTVVPLVTEAFDWEHGVFLGSVMSSEKTAAAAGTVGELRFDPFAMLPFCGYNMADYFAHWLEIGRTAGAKLPKIFYVNWFRKDEDGRFLWPGFGENSRVLAWVFARCAGHGAGERDADRARSRRSAPEGIDTRGVDVSDEDMAELLRVDVEEWRRSCRSSTSTSRSSTTCPHELARAAQGARRAPRLGGAHGRHGGHTARRPGLVRELGVPARDVRLRADEGRHLVLLAGRRPRRPVAGSRLRRAPGQRPGHDPGRGADACAAPAAASSARCRCCTSTTART